MNLSSIRSLCTCVQGMQLLSKENRLAGFSVGRKQGMRKIWFWNRQFMDFYQIMGSKICNTIFLLFKDFSSELICHFMLRKLLKKMQNRVFIIHIWDATKRSVKADETDLENQYCHPKGFKLLKKNKFDFFQNGILFKFLVCILERGVRNVDPLFPVIVAPLQMTDLVWSSRGVVQPPVETVNLWRDQTVPPEAAILDCGAI